MPTKQDLTKEQQHLLETIERTTDQFFSRDEFINRLAENRQLRIKFGVDVTAPTIHIGNAVNMWMMRALQDAGHKVIFLIGDFTTRIGDPSDCDTTRPILPRETIGENAKAFIEQAKMVLRFDDPNLLEIRHNSEWLDSTPLQTFLEQATFITHARLISRDMFQKRIADEREIHIHELLYPILQGYDSVALEADIVICGSDQLFNEMMGKTLQEKAGQKPQVIITSTITPGLDGGAKQSKSLGNYIGLAHTPRDKFGRTMRLIDPLIETYFRIYTDWPEEKIKALKPLIATNPLAAKQQLAEAIVARYHGTITAAEERAWWTQTFSQKQIPDDIPQIKAPSKTPSAFDLVRTCLDEATSNSQIRRLFAQGGIHLNDEKLTDPDQPLTLTGDDLLKTGKRQWFKITL